MSDHTYKSISNGQDYIYKRKDGGATWCYGKVEEDSNFSIVCGNEKYDGIAADVDTAINNTWFKVCKHLENNYRKDIEQIESC